MMLVSLLLAIAGLAAMGLSHPQHHGWTFHAQPSRGRATALRWGGLLVAFASLAPAMLAWGPALGVIGWLGLLSLAAFALLLIRTFSPQPPKTRR